jgi:hypothetical protein
LPTVTGRQWCEIIDGAGTGNSESVAMGVSNNLPVSHYMARILGSDGGAGAGQFFLLDGPGVPARSTGWHLLEAVVQTNSVQFYVDDVFSKSVPLTVSGLSYDTVRLGSNLITGSAISMHVDDVLVETVVPEPAATSLLLIAATPLLLRRRTRRP